jgi:hypothetical protein
MLTQPPPPPDFFTCSTFLKLAYIGTFLCRVYACRPRRKCHAEKAEIKQTPAKKGGGGCRCLKPSTTHWYTHTSRLCPAHYPGTKRTPTEGGSHPRCLFIHPTTFLSALPYHVYSRVYWCPVFNITRTGLPPPPTPVGHPAEWNKGGGVTVVGLHCWWRNRGPYVTSVFRDCSLQARL